MAGALCVTVSVIHHFTRLGTYSRAGSLHKGEIIHRRNDSTNLDNLLIKSREKSSVLVSKISLAHVQHCGESNGNVIAKSARILLWVSAKASMTLLSYNLDITVYGMAFLYG